MVTEKFVDYERLQYVKYGPKFPMPRIKGSFYN